MARVTSLGAAAPGSRDQTKSTSGTAADDSVVFAPHPGVSLDSSANKTGTVDESTGSAGLPSTPLGPGAATQTSPARLGRALDTAAKSSAPFLGRYVLLGSRSRKATDESTIQLARGKTDDLEYALKVRARTPVSPPLS